MVGEPRQFAEVTIFGLPETAAGYHPRPVTAVNYPYDIV